MNIQNSSSFVLTLPLQTNISDISALNKYFELSRRYYNAILGQLLNKYYLMIQSKKYQQIRKLQKSKERDKMFEQLEIEFGLRSTAINKLITSLRVNEFKVLGSHITIKLQLRAMQAIEKLRFSNAKKVNFIKYNEMNSIESSDNKQGIKYRDGYIIFNKLKIPVIIDKNDIYSQKAIQSRIKYCRLKKEIIKNKEKYYVQLILEGIPPEKDNLNLGNGKVGIDIGTQTIAITSKNDIKLLELAEGLNNIYKTKCKLQRKLDRQRRSSNPDNYNENGTIKKSINGKKLKWIKSNNYKKTQMKLRDIQRKLAIQREEKHNILANYIIGLGSNIKVETMNYKALQKRKKKTEKNDKGKFKKKKRFGKSLANKAPSKLLSIIKRKLKYTQIDLKEINTKEVKASQYNHINDNYKKKELKERWNYFIYKDEEIKVQRDIYSAYLIMNVNEDLNTINKEECKDKFDNFLALHNKEIYRIKNSSNKMISSMGM